MHKPSIIVNNLKIKMQANYILDGTSFSVLSNQHLAIIGDAGSGKTLLAKALAGKIFFEGTIETGNAKIIMVGQHYHFRNLSNTSGFYYQQRYNSSDSDDALTVNDELLQISNNEVEIDDLLHGLQLYHRKHSPLLHLSSGEHKRFQLIKAFVGKPDILILDNPYAGLDIKSRKNLSFIFQQLSANNTRLIIITQPNEIPDCITHILHLEKGNAEYFEAASFISRQVLSTNSYEHYFSNLTIGNKTKSDFSVAVEMKNVCVKYHDQLILNNINWKVSRGEKWLIKGSNGAGKSTLLSLITGDNPQAYANDIVLFDRRRGTGESIWDIKKNIGYVSPELHWYFETNITCFQTIGSGFFDTIGLYKKLNGEQQNKIHEWLYYFNINHLADKLLSSVSAGNQRLILLARALVKDPSLLILDEPCQGLDDHQKSGFVQLIDDICANGDTTLIYVSHYDDEIPHCVNNVLHLEKGNQTITQSIYHSNAAEAV